MREYVYYGPVSSLQLRGRRTAVRLVDGGRVQLPPADPRVRRLVARKALVPAALVELQTEPEALGRSGQVPVVPTEATIEIVSTNEEHFPASEQPTRSGKKKRKARHARSTFTQNSEPPASGDDFDAGGDHVAPETSEDPLSHD